MDPMISPLFPEDQKHSSENDGTQPEFHVDISVASAQAGIFATHVNSSLSGQPGSDLGFELAPPDISGLTETIEQTKIPRNPNQNTFPALSFETILISPDDIIPVPLKNIHTQSSQGNNDSVKRTKVVSSRFNELLPYLEKIHKFCSKIDINNLEDGISGIATILFYFVEGLDIFVTNKQYGLNNRKAFIEMISGDVIPRSSKQGVKTFYRDIQKTTIPRFKAFELEELGLQFIEYFSLYQELKNARNNPSEKGIGICKLGEFVMCAKVDFAQISTELFFQRRKYLFPDKTE